MGTLDIGLTLWKKNELDDDVEVTGTLGRVTRATWELSVVNEWVVRQASWIPEVGFQIMYRKDRKFAGA